MELSELYTEIGQLLNDRNNQRWPKTVLLPRINQAQIQVLGYTNSVKTKETLTPVAGTADVQLDTDVMDIIRVYIKNSSDEWKKLGGMLRDQLDFTDPNWQNLDDNEPQVYTWDGTTQKLTLVPAPTSAWANTDGLIVWEVQKPSDLSGTTDVPFGSNNAMIPYHMAIAYWVAAQCWMDDGTPEALAKSRFHRSMNFGRPGNFETEIKRIWSKFDTPEDIPARILWRPTGGRANSKGIFTKSNPLGQ